MKYISVEDFKKMPDKIKARICIEIIKGQTKLIKE